MRVSQASTQAVWNRCRHARRLTTVPGWKSRYKSGSIENLLPPYLWCRWHTVLPPCPLSPPPCCISAWRMISLFSLQIILQLRGHYLCSGACICNGDCQLEQKYEYQTEWTFNILHYELKIKFCILTCLPLSSSNYWSCCSSSLPIHAWASCLPLSGRSPPISASFLSSAGPARIHPLQAWWDSPTPVTPASEGGHVPHLQPPAVHAVQVLFRGRVTQLLAGDCSLIKKGKLYFIPEN